MREVHTIHMVTNECQRQWNVNSINSKGENYSSELMPIYFADALAIIRWKKNEVVDRWLK